MPKLLPLLTLSWLALLSGCASQPCAPRLITLERPAQEVPSQKPGYYLDELRKSWAQTDLELGKLSH